MAQRNRRSKGKPPHNHSHAHDHPTQAQTPTGWPTSDTIAKVFDVPSALTGALADVTPEDVLTLLNRMPAESRSFVLRNLNLRAVRQANRPMAAQLLAMLRRDKDPARSTITRSLLGPMLRLFDLTELTAEQWGNLAGEDLASSLHTVQAVGTDLLNKLNVIDVDIPAPLHRVGLLAAVADAPSAAAALAFLAMNDAAAAEAHTELVADYPDMPPVPDRDLATTPPGARLREHGVLDSRQEVSWDMLVMVTEALEREDAAEDEDAEEVDDHTAGAGSENDPEDGLEDSTAPASDDSEENEVHAIAMVADLISDWDDVTDTARNMHQHLAAGRAPSVEDALTVLSFCQDAALVAAALGEHLDETVTADRSALTAAADKVLERQQAADTSWVDDLTNLTGPAAVADQLASVSDLAYRYPELDETTVAGLEALHDLIGFGTARRLGGTVEFGDLARAEQQARAGLPTELHPVILAAAFGELTVTEPADEPPADPAPSDAAAPDDGNEAPTQGTAPPPVEVAETHDRDAQPAADVATADVDEQSTAGAEPAAESDSDATETLDSDAIAAPDGDDIARTRTESAEPSDAFPLDEPAHTVYAQTSAPANVDAHDIDPDNIDLSDLDQLLGGHTGAALVALTKPKRRGTQATTTADETDQGPTGDTDADEPTDEHDADSAEVTTDAVRAAEDDLLAAGRYGLAANLAHATGAPAASVAARKLACYGAALRHPTGPLASAFAEAASDITREALAEDRAGQLLAWAAAARVAVLAPSAGAAGVLAELAVCVEAQDGLTEVGQALAEASRAGVVVVAENADTISALAHAEDRVRDQAAAAADLLQAAGTRTIKYVPANAVYQTWLHPDGDLGALLADAASNNTANVADVRDRVVQMRGKGDKAIKDTWSKLRRLNQQQIVAGARHTLLQRYDEALDVVADWATAVTAAVDARARVQNDAWQATPLAHLRSRLTAVRETCLDELTRMREQAASTDEPTSAVTGAATAVQALLADAFDISDGHPPTGPEPSPQFALHAELLATGLPLDPDTLEPVDVNPADDDDAAASDAFAATLLKIAQAPAAPAADVYTRRADLGDHDLTAALLTGLRITDPATARTLERRRDTDVATAAAEVGDLVAELSDTIDARRLSGSLDETTWSSAAAQVTALAAPHRTDFGRIRAEVHRIRATLDAAREQLTAATIDRILEKAATNPTVAADADKLIDLARSGEIASAEEFLEQLSDGGQLPTEDDTVDHLQQFYPAVPDLCGRHDDLLDQVRAALRPGGEPTPAVTELAACTGTGPADLSTTRREAGNRALGAWGALRSRTGKVNAADAVRAVLGQAGLEFAGLQVHPTSQSAPGRQWLTLTGVDGTGKALTPALGSGMSPDGNTLRVLLVKAAASPATVIEWMANEPADHTVLVLWLAAPLSRADRRSVIEAARGRSKPPVLILDSAVLAYLTLQHEPRRSTFAALALPFTAASPFRDTPGDAPPEMFYGRKEELDAIQDLKGSSNVSGGRQAGKSALLRAAQRRFDNGSNRRAVLRSIYTVGSDGRPERLWDALWPKLAEIGIVPDRAPVGDLAPEVHAAVLAWLEADDTRALLILLDEADVFLDADAAGNRFTHVDWCRRLMLDSGSRVKVVFAGLHRTARFESLPNQPLSHLGRPISVGPLRPQHAYDLLTKPLAALGFRFADRLGLPARVLALTNNMPALVQLFGAALVKHLTSREVPPDGPPTLIGEEDVDAVLADPTLLDQFRDKYVLTLRLDPRYLVIANVVAQAAHEHGKDTTVTLSELSEECRAAWPAGFTGCGADDFRGLVTECVDLGVLAIDNGAYRMRTPTVLRLLGTEDEVFETLYTAQERLTVPSASDGASYRRRLGDGQHRSPLTETQLGRILAPTSKVLLVRGTPALGLDRLAAALTDAKADGAGRIDSVRKLTNNTPEGVKAAVARTTGAHDVVIVDARAVTPATLTRLLDAAHDAVTTATGCRTIVVVASPTSAPAWSNVADAMDLHPLDATGLRLWCDEDNLPFHDDTARAALLTATGGWPVLLDHVARDARAGGPLDDPEHILTKVTADLTTKAGAATMLTAAGLTLPSADTATRFIGAALTAVFREVVEWTATGSEPRSLLVEVLQASGDHVTQLVTAAGFASAGDVLDVLIATGAVRVDVAGNVAADRLLASAVSVAQGKDTAEGAR